MKFFTTRGFKVAALLLAAGLIAGCNQENSNMNGFIDIDKVLQSSGLMAQEQAHLQQVQKKLEEGAMLAEKQYGEMSEEKALAARQSDAQVLNMQWQTEQVAARNVTLAAVKKRAQELLKADKLRAILPAQSAIAIAPESDVSGKLADMLRDETLSFGALPEVQVSAPQPLEPEQKAKPSAKK